MIPKCIFNVIKITANFFFPNGYRIQEFKEVLQLNPSDVFITPHSGSSCRACSSCKKIQTLPFLSKHINTGSVLTEKNSHVIAGMDWINKKKKRAYLWKTLQRQKFVFQKTGFPQYHFLTNLAPCNNKLFEMHLFPQHVPQHLLMNWLLFIYLF